VVDHADNGLTGYHLAMTAEYDLLILDIMLPDVNGWDIIRMLRTAGGMPVLFSALGTIEHRVKGLELVQMIIWLNPLPLPNFSLVSEPSCVVAIPSYRKASLRLPI
jgi:CheY-like chemotaxis protein